MFVKHIPCGAQIMSLHCREVYDSLHGASAPLHFLHNVEAAMDNELVHVSLLLTEAGNAVTALF
jgi:hypothetical protein